MTSASSSLLKDHEKFKRQQADAAALLASAAKRQKVHQPSSQKPNRPKSGVSRSKNVSGLIYSVFILTLTNFFSFFLFFRLHK